MSFTDQKKNWNRLAEVDPMWAILSEPDKLGNNWDEAEFYRTGVIEAADVMNQLEGLDLRPEFGDVLEVGCGAGRVCHAFAKYFESVTGYDISPEMVKLAQKNGAENETFVLNTTDDLSVFEDRSFDFVYCNRVMQHLDPDRLSDYLSEMVRVLRPGGVLWLQMLSHPTGDRDPARESSPLPEWAENGELPQYTICCVAIDLMLSGFLEMDLIVHQARCVDGGKDQSLYSYEYVVQTQS